jgi:cytosine/adenosine deaminase-related metal-dependent hydrolase
MRGVPRFSVTPVSDLRDRARPCCARVTRPSGTIYWGRFLLPFDAAAVAIPDAGIHVGGGGTEVTDLGPIAELRRRYPDVQEVGGADFLVMPGLIDAHQHGRPVSPLELGCWDETLELWLLEQRGIERPGSVLSARVAAMRALLGGVTTMLHPHITGAPRPWLEELLEVADAYARSGMRVVFGMDVRDRGSFTYDDDSAFLATVPSSVRALVERHLPAGHIPTTDELEDAFDALSSATKGTNVRPALAPRGPQWCSGPLLDWVADRSNRGTLVQVHASETMAQYGWFAERGESPIRYLGRHGLLSPRVTLAHCVWLDGADVAAISEHGAVVAHNPTSNLRLRSGRAPTPALRAARVPAGVGTDSTGSGAQPDLFGEIRLARWLEQLGDASVDLSPEEHLRETLRGGAAAAGLPDHLGRLAIGAAADLVLLAWDELARGREYDDAAIPRLVAELASRQHVSGVVVAGRQVVADGRYLLDDAGALEEALREEVYRLPQHPGRRATVRSLRPFVEKEMGRLQAVAASADFVL